MFIAPNIIIGFNIEELSQLRRSSGLGAGPSPTSSQSNLLQTQYNFSQPSGLAVIKFIFSSVDISLLSWNEYKSAQEFYFKNADFYSLVTHQWINDNESFHYFKHD